MNRALLSLILLVALAWSTPARAQPLEAPLTPQELAFAMEIATTYQQAIQIGDRLDFDRITEEQLGEKLQHGFDTILKTWIDQCPSCEKQETRPWFKKISSWVKWRTYARWTISMRNNILAAYRTYGSSYLYLFSLTSILKVLAPALMIHYGVPDWILPWEIIPIKPVFFGAYAYWANRQLHKNILKIYGGQEAYDQIKAAEREFYKGFKFYYSSDLFFPIQKDGEYWKSILISEGNWWVNQGKALVDSLGIKKDGMTLAEIKEFCNETDLTDSFLETLWKQDDTPVSIRTAMTAQYVQMKGSPSQLMIFDSLFSKYMRDGDGTVTSDWQPIVTWAKQAVRSRTLDDLKKSFELIPLTADMRGVLTVLKKSILPRLAKNSKKIGRSQFAVLTGRRYQEMIFQAEKNPSFWNTAWHALFQEWVDDAKKTTPCSWQFLNMAI